jgi:FtsH-binding integral membrane protein
MVKLIWKQIIKGGTPMKMKMNKNLGMLLLSVWLILTGLLQFVSIPIPSIDIILAVLAIAAGLFIIQSR